MSEKIHRFVAGEKITVASTLGHEASGMDRTEGRSLLGNGSLGSGECPRCDIAA